ncbi:hypothetical protein [Nakamurella lactea]|uniref:hypothetical protein n=1 Tax=Nakamurella lactea TaxID=459515 RepID=UPI0012B5805F|nr:hypothetical protein [Nakamurella lactea]
MPTDAALPADTAVPADAAVPADDVSPADRAGPTDAAAVVPEGPTLPARAESLDDARKAPANNAVATAAAERLGAGVAGLACLLGSATLRRSVADPSIGSPEA